MHLAQRLWFGGAALAMAAVLTVADSGPVYAQKKKETQAESNAQLTQALTTLHNTKLILEAADHDYGGHRAAAVRAIGGAQHQLRLALGIKGVKGAKAPAPKGNTEPQAQSDMQLAQAIPVLKQTVTVMNNANHDYKGHRADAVRDVQEAIVQLEKALKYIKTKEDKKSS